MQSTSISEVAQDKDGNPYRQYYVPGQPAGTWQIRVWNNPGYELPHTGGSGTFMFTVGGLVLIVLALAGLALDRLALAGLVRRRWLR